jgi:hypothetical protein
MLAMKQNYILSMPDMPERLKVRQRAEQAVLDRKSVHRHFERGCRPRARSYGRKMEVGHVRLVLVHRAGSGPRWRQDWVNNTML